MTKEEKPIETDPAILEFLANGGKITQCAYGKSGRADGESYSSWSKKKPVKSPLASPPDEDD